MSGSWGVSKVKGNGGETGVGGGGGRGMKQTGASSAAVFLCCHFFGSLVTLTRTLSASIARVSTGTRVNGNGSAAAAAAVGTPSLAVSLLLLPPVPLSAAVKHASASVACAGHERGHGFPRAGKIVLISLLERMAGRITRFLRRKCSAILFWRQV